jgi:hypothetical protein
MTVTGIDHVRRRTAAAVKGKHAFYGRILGLEELPKPEPLAARGGCWFRAGDRECTSASRTRSLLHARRIRGFVVAELDQLASRLNAAGVAIVHDEAPRLEALLRPDPFETASSSARA